MCRVCFVEHIAVFVVVFVLRFSILNVVSSVHVVRVILASLFAVSRCPPNKFRLYQQILDETHSIACLMGTDLDKARASVVPL